MTKAYLVWGAESSGTRLVTQTLCAYGCLGDSDHVQCFDTLLPPPTEQPIVWRRSFPHAKEWPDPLRLIQQVANTGYNPVPVVIIRDRLAVVKSQVAVGHVLTAERARYNYNLAYCKIFSALVQCSNIEHIVLTYSNLIQRPVQVMKNHFPDLTQIDELIFTDMNQKWYGE